MDQMTQQNAAMVNEATAAARSLADQADELSTLVARFRLRSTAAAMSSAPPARSARPLLAAAR